MNVLKKWVTAPSYRWASVTNRMNRVFKDTCKIPLGNIVLINSYRRNSPRTSNTTTRQAAEIKLAANLKREQRGTELILLERLSHYRTVLAINKIILVKGPKQLIKSQEIMTISLDYGQANNACLFYWIHSFIDFDRIFQVWCINANSEKIFFSMELTCAIQDTFIKNDTKLFYSAAPILNWCCQPWPRSCQMH